MQSMRTKRRPQTADISTTSPLQPGPRQLGVTRVVADQRQLFDTILGNLSQGVLMFDKNARLVFCNRRYVEMYGLSCDVAKPGCTLRNLINHRISVRSFSGNPRDYISKLLQALASGKQFNDVTRLSDRRVFSVMNKPILGGGWLATHEDITERERTQEQIARMARHDALTDLPNRVLLRERLEDELKRVKRGECIAVLCLDLDHFKDINDTLGHPVGDELLKVTAGRLRRCTREPDTVARLGGDEFAIIMTGMQQPTDAAALATRLRESITKPYRLNGHQVLVDISVGISVAPADAVDPDQLLKNADMALYEAKGDGRGA
jgi:diguanylate cyclase (GGDEF)-like protein